MTLVPIAINTRTPKTLVIKLGIMSTWLCLLGLFLGSSPAMAGEFAWDSKKDFEAGTFYNTTVAGNILVLTQAENWWDEEWKYRIRFSLHEQSGTSIEGYEAQLVVDTETLITAGSMKEDGSDLRFVDDNQDTLSYFIAGGLNTTSTEIYVRIPEMTAFETTIIWMYYGNTGVDSQSSITDTFTWYENFSQDTLDLYQSKGLNGYGDDHWEIADGYAFNINTLYPLYGSYGSLIIADLTLEHNFGIETLAVNYDDDGIGVIANVDENGDCYYTAQSWPQEESHEGISRCATDSTVAAQANLSVEPGSRHVYTLLSFNGQLTMLVDGTKVATYTDREPLTGKYLGILSAKNNPYAYFDYLKVWRYINPSPVVEQGAEEQNGYLSSGTWESQVLDSECEGTGWNSLAWDPDIPESSQLSLALRTGNTPWPDDTWTPWSPELVRSEGSDPEAKPGRYAQIRATLSTSDATATPGLDRVDLTSEEESDADEDGYQAFGCGGDDCNDQDSSVHPESLEIPYDGIDQDCDGSDLADLDGDGYDGGSGGSDCNDADDTIHPDHPEECDGVDEDCNDTVDDNPIDGDLYYVDADGDGYGDPSEVLLSCTLIPGTVTDSTDCDDDNADIHPNGVEICNSLDDDCNGSIDEGVGTLWYVDADGDDYGDPENTVIACSQPDNTSSNGTDCDDTNPFIHPGAFEICGDGVDQNCNGFDPGCSLLDLDGDGYSPIEGDCDDTNPQIHPNATDIPYNGVDEDCAFGDLVDVDGDGYEGGGGPDCDDLNPEISPGAAESCDGVDNDCNGAVDDIDNDGDGFASDACGGSDCNDGDSSVSPAAEEQPDGQDDDCDGVIDEGTELYDDDGDGFSEATGDCDNQDAAVYPGATDIPLDGIDQDCDGQDSEEDPSPSPSPDVTPTETPTEDTPEPTNPGVGSPEPTADPSSETTPPKDLAIIPDIALENLTGGGCSCSSGSPSGHSGWAGVLVPFLVFLRTRARRAGMYTR